MQSLQNVSLPSLPTASDQSALLDAADDGDGFTSSLGGLPSSSLPSLGQTSQMSQAAPGGSAGMGTAPSDAAAATIAGSTTAATGDTPDPSIDNSSQQSSPQDLQKLAPLVQGLPADQQAAAETAMNRPIVAAKMLKDGSPDEKKAAQAYFDQNPALKTALDTAAHGGKPDGNISDHDLSAFIGKMSDQQGRAANTVAQFQKDHPNADGQSLQLVRQSALLQAYMPVLQANSPDKDGNAGQYMTQDGLKAVLGDADLPSALQGAANTFSQPGMFEMLDQGGLQGHDLATHNADGNVSEQNIIDWVSKQAPTTGGQFASMIGDAATRNAVAGVDTSQLNQDVFQNPQNYSGAQKAAVLIQLQDKQQQLQAGSDLKKNDKTDDAISKDISQLSGDADVQQYLSQAVPQGEKQIVGSDPSLARAVASTYQNDVVSGTMLQSGLSAVSKNNADNKNPKQTAGSAVSDFAAQTQLDSDLSNGQSATAQQIVAGSTSLTSQLQGDYQSDFSQGGELKQLQGEKDADLGTSLQTTQGDEQAFEGVLDPSFVQSQSAQYASTMTSGAMGDGGSGKAVVSALQSGGKADTSDIAKSIAEVDPNQLYGGSKTTLTSSDTQALVSSFLDDLNGGASVQDACAKFDPDSPGFDDGACDGKVMAKLQSNPAAAQGVQTMLQTLAANALGLAPPGAAAGGASSGSAAGGGAAASASGPVAATGTAMPVSDAAADPGGAAAPVSAGGGAGSASGTPDSAVIQAQPGATGAEKAEQGTMYAGLGLGLASMGTFPANYANNTYWNNRGANDGDERAQLSKGVNASRISMAGEAAGGIGGILGAAAMLPDISEELRNGQTTQAGLSIAGSARGIVQGGALAANVGDMAARRMGGASSDITSYALRRGGTLGLTASTAGRDVGGRWAGDMVSRTVGQVAGRVGAAVGGEVAGAAAAEAIGASVPVVGWIADAAIGIGFIGELIANAVKKSHEKKEMANTVNPTLKQYGIPEV